MKLYLKIFCFTFVTAAMAVADPTATIVGRVTDASGAVVQQVTVSAVNTATSLERHTLTSDTGDFEIPLLPITGSYTLTATKAGFQTQQISGIVLQVDQQARFDIKLNVGNVSQKIEVVESAPLVNTDNATVGQVIDNKTIVELPLNGRNFTQLATLTPGAIEGSPGSNTGFTTISVNGGQAPKTEFLLDGISNQEQLYNGVQFTPSVDAIQEFKVEGNAFSAEYGRGDAVINATIKAGTNQFRGVLWEFLRNDALDARNFFDNAKTPYRQNQFGGTLGGPIVRNKTFFFVNYEGTRIVRGLTSNTPVPSAALRSGDFSSLGTAIHNPQTGASFPGNTIPSGLIDPSSAFFLKFIPLPNTAAGSFVYGAPYNSNVDQGNIRGDHRFSDSDTLFARYSVNNIHAFNPGIFPQVGGVSDDIRTQNAALDEVHIFKPTIINDLRLGYGRMYSTNSPQGLGTNYTTQAGITGFEQTSINFPGFPSLSISGYGTLINGNPYSPLTNPSNMYEIIDGMTWIKGAHTIRFGADLRRYEFTSTNSANSRGAFSFSGSYSGDAFADYLLGYPSSGFRDFPRNLFGEDQLNHAFYVQDDYKVTSRLTLNLGLRFEYNPAFQELQDQAADFDQQTGKIIVALYKGSINLTTQQVAKFGYPQYANDIITPSQANLPNKLRFDQYNWAPRLGLAFRPSDNNNTVIRAGFGVFYLLQSGNNTVSYPIINPPFILDESKSQTTVNGVPTLRMENFFEPFTVNTQFNSPLVFSYDPRNQTPYVTEWNFTVQRKLGNNMALDIGYLGSKGTHLEMITPGNVPPINPNDTRTYQERVPFPQFGGSSYLANQNNSTYHALQVKLQKRFSSGLSFLASYTLSKSIDGTSDPGGDRIQDPFDLHSMKGVSDYDIPQRLVVSYGYELPFGHGKRFMNSAPWLVDELFGGWQVVGITTFQSGFPFTPFLASNDPGNVNFAYDIRPNVIGNPSVPNCTPAECFNVAAFGVPAPFTFGNAGRNILRGPGTQNWDFSVLKNFHIGETRYLQFRSEFFNIFNHANFNNPNPYVDTPQAGQIFSAKDPRIIQFALKLYF